MRRCLRRGGLASTRGRFGSLLCVQQLLLASSQGPDTALSLGEFLLRVCELLLSFDLGLAERAQVEQTLLGLRVLLEELVPLCSDQGQQLAVALAVDLELLGDQLLLLCRELGGLLLEPVVCLREPPDLEVFLVQQLLLLQDDGLNLVALRGPEA